MDEFEIGCLRHVENPSALAPALASLGFESVPKTGRERRYKRAEPMLWIETSTRGNKHLCIATGRIKDSDRPLDVLLQLERKHVLPMAYPVSDKEWTRSGHEISVGGREGKIDVEIERGKKYPMALIMVRYGD